MSWLFLRGMVLALAAAATLGAAACGGDGDDGGETPNRRFAGRVEGTDAFIGVATGEGAAIVAYVCDGQEISQWFKGFVEGDSAEVAAEGACSASSWTMTAQPGRSASPTAARTASRLNA